jgi:predicted metalloprotease
MRLDDERESDNIEDRRSGGLPVGGVGLGTLLVALIASAVFGVNPMQILSLLEGGAPATPQTGASQPGTINNDAETRFVRKVLASTEDVWSAEFQRRNAYYQPPTLVLFRGTTPTACGTGQAAVGPFYCPGDQKVYIDLGFYDILKNQLGSPGDFAQAYVIAHEVGHHIQKLTGISDKVDARRGQLSPAQQNALSVRVELQADCYAGIWANRADSAKQILEAGDLEQAINAAGHIGDDALQQAQKGVVVPETFTHGTSQQRIAWFKRGWESGDLRDCNTFAARSL